MSYGIFCLFLSSLGRTLNAKGVLDHSQHFRAVSVLQERGSERTLYSVRYVRLSGDIALSQRRSEQNVEDEGIESQCLDGKACGHCQAGLREGSLLITPVTV